MQRRGNTGQSVKGGPKVRQEPTAGVSTTDLQEQVAALTRELKEAREQQTATADVLKVISSSTSDLQAVFDTMAENAVRLCEAERGYIFRFDGKLLRAVASYNAGSEHWELVSRNPIAPGRHSISARAALERRTVHVADVQADPEFAYINRDVEPIRTTLAVPMLEGDDLVGTITIYRLEVKPFTDKQVALVETFAAQAVIAIENTRLLNELRDSLQQQTATADVLKVISRSTFDLPKVLGTLVESAATLCAADKGVVFQRDGDLYRLAANYGFSREAEQYALERPVRPDRGSVTGRVALEGRAIHISDVLADPEYQATGYQQAFGYRTILGVPLFREGVVIGVFLLTRDEVSPFAEKQINLVTTFADQAMIAIENVRLFDEVQARTHELSEALEQQTATSEVLKVISSSAGELQPVFDTMLAKSAELCEASFGAMWLVDGEGYRTAALHGDLPEAYIKQWRSGTLHLPTAAIPMVRAIRSRKTVHVSDMRKDKAYLEGDPLARSAADIAGVRTLVTVPMLKEGEAIGVITIYRKEVRDFSDKQIELVTNFAAQAVIAIENARLLDELRESLQQQTATADVLKVISSSPGDLGPVFEAMLANAVRICEANFGVLFRSQGVEFYPAAWAGVPPEYEEFLRRRGQFRPTDGAPLDRLLKTKQLVFTVDELAERHPGPAAEFGGARSLIAVPMFKDGELVGAIVIYRQEVRPFTDRQVALVSNFASQAVIAIENTRLLNELRQRTDDLTESLEQQTATSEVLRVISSSPTNVQPVFDTIAESAVRLCDGQFSFVLRFDGKIMDFASCCGLTAEGLDAFRSILPMAASQDTASGRAIVRREVVEIPDVEADPTYGARGQGLAKAVTYRSIAAVPLLHEGNPIGAIAVARANTGPFPKRQIVLLQAFADQAVIAIGNVRLFDEVQMRTRELSESLQQQTATAEVLKVISRSTFDLQAVLDTLIESAVRLCEADHGWLFRREGKILHWVASFGYGTDAHSRLREFFNTREVVVDRGSVTGRAALEARAVQVPDVLLDPEYTYGDAQKVGGYRAGLGVPLLRAGEVIGVIFVNKVAPVPFSDKQVELVTTFADQAVIAIENVRLFESVEARTRDLAKSLDDLRTTQDRLVQTQKLASLGQLTAGIAHEIKNPLNFVNNFSGISAELITELQEALADVSLSEKRRNEITDLMDTLRGNLEKVVQHGKRADAIVKNMLLHSREGSGEHRPVDINAIVEESLTLAYHGARAEKQGFNINLERSLDPGAGEADVFPQDITRALLNLISNGFYAAIKRRADGNGDYEPTLAAATKNLGDRVEITIRDNGSGIPPDVKDKMFNPFFTTKPTGEGTGLGLSISHDIIVKQHGGSIEVDTQPGEFTEIRVILPRVSAFLPERP